MKRYSIFITVFLIVIHPTILFSSNDIIFNNEAELLNISDKLLIYSDSSKSLNIHSILKKDFTPSKTSVPNLGLSDIHYWVKIPITNKSNYENLILELSIPIIDHIEFYELKNDKYEVKITGDQFSFQQREYNDPHYIFDINIPKGSSKVFYCKVWSNEAIQLPINIGKKEALFNQIKIRDILSGIYVGIMLVMIMYNLFIYFSVKDNSYLFYVVYIFFILLTQTSLQGYTFQYLWPNSNLTAKYSLIFLPSFSAITGMYFMHVFLKTKEYSKWLYRLSFILITPYLFAFLIAAKGMLPASQGIIQLSSGIVSLYMLFVPIYILRKGFKPAKYFLVAWSTFLVGVIIFILKDADVLPFNNYTRYTMQIGSAIETILLSFALAARINTYKKERLEALLEKETLVREQNIFLEKQVKERTQDLESALMNLKETQAQLVDAEKMSSLGQLTAGIAHEINNPINFVSSNISPLRQDIEDLEQILSKYEELKITDNIEDKFKEIDKLKKELDFEYLKSELPSIINGIEDGANRTKQIVSGLRNFSRLDEVEFQKADINEGIESTLILIKSKLNDIKLTKNLSELPIINCFPSKLNQLFMNLIDNAIGAIEEKRTKDGEITISTYTENNHVCFKITDNGIGIKNEVLPKIFDPFFTTKDVGKGTGLGLSICRGIVDAHKGMITINSEENKGTELIVKIPNK